LCGPRHVMDENHGESLDGLQSDFAIYDPIAADYGL
jgi:hypothetical protein